VSQNNKVKYTSKANSGLVIRMHFEHNYSVQDICLRLRYPETVVEEIIIRHLEENDKSRSS
jgi:hypothetical protein